MPEEALDWRKKKQKNKKKPRKKKEKENKKQKKLLINAELHQDLEKTIIAAFKFVYCI